MAKEVSAARAPMRAQAVRADQCCSASRGGRSAIPVSKTDTSSRQRMGHRTRVDLLFEPGRDTNLRAALAHSFGTWDSKAVFYPLADGIVDAPYNGSFN